MSEGLTDIVVQPYKGAKKEGTKGAMKGIAKGTVSLATKPLSGELLFKPCRTHVADPPCQQVF